MKRRMRRRKRREGKGKEGGEFEKGKDSNVDEGKRKKSDEATGFAALSNCPRLRLTLALKATSEPLKPSALPGPSHACPVTESDRSSSGAN